MSANTNKFIRDLTDAAEPPSKICVRYFYTSPTSVDDPLSPLPPPLTSTSAYKQPPRPFSEYDSAALDEAWNGLRRRILKFHEEQNDEKQRLKASMPLEENKISGQAPKGRNESSKTASRGSSDLGQDVTQRVGCDTIISGGGRSASPVAPLETSLKALEPTMSGFRDSPFDKATTGRPFARAPSRKKVNQLFGHDEARTSTRPQFEPADSYEWDVDEAPGIDNAPSQPGNAKTEREGPKTEVPVGISRLHKVLMPRLEMHPIYWSPVHDIAMVSRGTWFYHDTMLPVEVNVANMLEAGYCIMQPWSETWKDELNSAVEAGATGEMKVTHKLWPELTVTSRRTSRPGTSQSVAPQVEERTPERVREESVEAAGDLIDVASGVECADNKAAGNVSFGKDGSARLYLDAGVIYANEKDAYILRPSLQPSSYYGRRPLANYIRKDYKIGIRVLRGFDQDVWDKLHPPKRGTTVGNAGQGVSTSQVGVRPDRRQKSDPALSQAVRPVVSDLVLVIHGIGQKLSERVESYHFTHAINAFRRDFNVELGNSDVRKHLRPDAGGIMVLPVNWRSTLKFEDGGYRDGPEDDSSNRYSLKDITPDTIPSVRGVINDVLFDIPFYLSHHQPKMIQAVISESNRIYRLWCQHNPGFAEWGKVHILAHSLGSVMALDVLSRQPTVVDAPSPDADSAASEDRFAFNTSILFLCGSPVGFFLLLRKASLRPRYGIQKDDDNDESLSPGLTAEEGQYGCLAVRNIYNVINPYDPVAYRMNPTIDAEYSSSLQRAVIPPASRSWIGSISSFGAFSGTKSGAEGHRPSTTRLPSNVELETHNFTREEIAEKRAYLLNDNGQIDFYLKYGGGPLEIQYLTMLGAHSSYWISRDFVRFMVIEMGREQGRKGTRVELRPVKKKGVARAR